MRRKISFVMFSIALGFAMAFADITVLAEKQDPSNSKAQTTSTKQTSPSKKGSANKKTTDTTTTTEATGDQTPAVTQQEMTPAATQPAKPARKSRKRTAAPAPPEMATTQTEQTDLSGTYAGTFKCDDIGLTGDTTLTVTGNQFTTSDGKTGRIVASTTRGYTAVALQVGDATAAAMPTVISLRARKTGDRLTLSSVAESAHACSFTPARAVASRRSRRSQQTVPAAVGTEVATPAEAGPAPADVTTPAAPAKGRTRRGAAKSKTGMLPSPKPATVPSPKPSESPATVPMPTESPAQSPSPSPSPSPAAKRP